jgi:peptidoglycan hydrolase-like protein with peptidoglycan-binding domain
MKQFLVVVMAVVLAASVLGCGKKAEDLQEPATMDAMMTTVNVTTPAAPEVKAPEVKATDIPAIPAAETSAVTAFGKPTPLQIQTALQAAGLYAGELDGKIGPKTKKAIQDFQTSNGLKADGKVGPKTWELLKAYLAAPTESAGTGKKR